MVATKRLYFSEQRGWDVNKEAEDRDDEMSNGRDERV